MPMLKLMSVCAAHGSCRFSTTWSQEAPGGAVAKLEVAEPAICSGMRRHRFRYGVRPWSRQIAEPIDNKGWFCSCRTSTQCSHVPEDGFAAIGAAHGHVAACRSSLHSAQLSHDSGGLRSHERSSHTANDLRQSPRSGLTQKSGRPIAAHSASMFSGFGTPTI